MNSKLAQSTSANQQTSLRMGVILCITSVLAIVVIAHHPMASGSSSNDIILSIRQQSTPDRLVHGGLMLLLGVWTTAMVYLSCLMGIKRPVVLAACLSYILAIVLLFISATLDGFAIPLIVGQCDLTTTTCSQTILTMLRLSSFYIETLTRSGLYAVAIAILLWAVDVLRRPGRAKVVGGIGIVSASVQFWQLRDFTVRLTPHSLLQISGAQILWYLATAALMAGWFGLGIDDEDNEL